MEPPRPETQSSPTQGVTTMNDSMAGVGRDTGGVCTTSDHTNAAVARNATSAGPCPLEKAIAPRRPPWLRERGPVDLREPRGPCCQGFLPSGKMLDRRAPKRFGNITLLWPSYCWTVPGMSFDEKSIILGVAPLFLCVTTAAGPGGAGFPTTEREMSVPIPSSRSSLNQEDENITRVVAEGGKRAGCSGRRRCRKGRGNRRDLCCGHG